MNLVDLCVIAVPTTFAGPTLPFGVTLSAFAGNDAFLCDVARRRNGHGVKVSKWNFRGENKQCQRKSQFLHVASSHPRTLDQYKFQGGMMI
jgi:hypothetical protein